MNKFGKFLAGMVFATYLCFPLRQCGVDMGDWIFWALMVPYCMGTAWIIEKLDK